MHKSPLQPLQPQNLLSRRSRMLKRKRILFLHLQWCLHNAPSNPETTDWWNRFHLANNRFMTTFHRPSSVTSPTSHATHQDSSSENAFPSSLGTQRNGDHFFLRGRTDPGGYWWPPTYSNWLLLSVFSSTCSFVRLCNCGFYTSRVV
jgi:hypothetical protein